MEEKIINSDLIPDFNKGNSENPNNIKEAKLSLSVPS